MGFGTYVAMGNLAANQVIVIDINGNVRVLAEGELPKPGELIVQGNEQLSSESLPFQVEQVNEDGENQDITAELEDIFAALEEGQDPTQLGEDFATAAGGQSSSSLTASASITRDGAESIARTDFSTEGFQSLGLSETQSLALLEQFRLFEPVFVDLNNNPLADDLAITTDEDTPISGTLVATDQNAQDILTFSQSSAPSNGTAVVNLDGTWTYTPNEFFNGSDSFTVEVSDGNGGTDTLTVNVTIQPVNETPIISIPEAGEDGLVNAVEASDGIQVSIELPRGTGVGDTLVLRDQNGQQVGERVITRDDFNNGNIVITVPTPEDGTYTYEGQITDPQGNVGPVSNEVGFELDTQYGEDGDDNGSIMPPTVIITDNSGQTDGSEEVINATETADITVNFGEGVTSGTAEVVISDEDNTTGNITLTLTWAADGTVTATDGDKTYSVTSTAAGQYTIEGVDVSGQKDGTLTATATFTDQDGNTVNNITDDVQKDTVYGQAGEDGAPTVAITDENGEEVINATETADITVNFGEGVTSGTAEVVISDEDNTTGNITLTLTWAADGTVTATDGDKTYSVTSTAAGQYTIEGVDVSGQKDGTLTATATFTDQDGNTVNNITDDVQKDTLAPIVPIITNIADDSSDSDYSVVTLHGTGEPGHEIKIFDEDGNLINQNSTVTVDDEGNWSFDISDLTNTQINDNEFFTATQVDAAGNESDLSDTVHYYHGDFDPALNEGSDDFVLLGDGDDVLRVNVDDANDSMVADGGAGTDKAVFDFSIEQASIVLNADGSVTVSENTGSGDVNTFIEFEEFEFEGGDKKSFDELFSPTIEIERDEDEVINSDRSTINYTVGLPVGTVAGATLIIMAEGQAIEQSPITLTQDHITNGTFSFSIDSGSVDSELNVSATLDYGNNQTFSDNDALAMNNGPEADDFTVDLGSQSSVNFIFDEHVTDQEDEDALTVSIDQEPALGTLYIVDGDDRTEVTTGTQISESDVVEYQLRDDINEFMSFDASEDFDVADNTVSEFTSDNGVVITGGHFEGARPDGNGNETSANLYYDSKYGETGLGVGDQEIDVKDKDFISVDFSNVGGDNTDITITQANVSIGSIWGNYEHGDSADAQIHILLFKDGQVVTDAAGEPVEFVFDDSVDPSVHDGSGEFVANIHYEDGFDEIRVFTTKGGTEDTSHNSNITLQGVDIVDATVSEEIAYTATDSDKGEDSGVITVNSSTTDSSITTPTIDLVASSDTGDSATDNITKDTTPTFALGNIDSDVAAEGIEVFKGGVVVQGDLDQIDGVWYFTPNSEVVSGSQQWSVKVTDDAGNTATSTKLVVTVDTGSEATISIHAIAGDDILDAQEASEDVVITGRVDGDAEPGDKVTLTLDAGDGSPVSAYTGDVLADGTYRISVPGSELASDADATLVASVSGEDQAGNAFTAMTAASGDNKDGGYHVDTAPVVNPTAVITDEDETVLIGWASLGVADSDSEDSTLSVTITTLPEGGQLQYYDGNDGWQAVAENQELDKATFDNNEVRFVPDNNLSGSSQIGFEASDGVNMSESATLTINVTPVADAPKLSLNTPDPDLPQQEFNVATWDNVVVDDTTYGAGRGVPGSDLIAQLSQLDKADAARSTTDNAEDSASTATDPNQAVIVTGLIYLEANVSYDFVGRGDDSIAITLGGILVDEGRWGVSSGDIQGSAFTPTESGYYPIAIYHHNQSGDGNFNVDVSIDGADPVDLANSQLSIVTDVGSAQDTDVRLSALQTDDNGVEYYETYSVNEGRQDTAIPLSEIDASLTDTDGSEALSILLSGIPVGATISDGSNTILISGETDENGQPIQPISVTDWALDNLTVTPPPGSHEDFTLTVTAVSSEKDNDSQAQSSLELEVVVHENEPTLTESDTNSGNEDQVISGNVLANDSDADDVLQVVSVKIDGTDYQVDQSIALDEGTFTIDANGQYRFEPTGNWSGSVPAIEYTTNTGATESLNLAVIPVADAPNLTVVLGDSVTTNVTMDSALHTKLVNGEALSEADKAALGVIGVVEEVNRSATGTNRAEVLFGSDQADTMYGKYGDDVFVGGTGDDKIDGDDSWSTTDRDGVDTVIYSGSLSNYTLVNNGDFGGNVEQWAVFDSTGRDASARSGTGWEQTGDHLYEIERLIFADAIVELNADGTDTVVQDVVTELNISASVSDRDGSEYLDEVRINGLPDDAEIVDKVTGEVIGSRDGDDWVIDVTGQSTKAVNYDNLAVKHQSTDSLDINVTAVAKESGLESDQIGNTTTVNSAASADVVADQGGDLPTTLITVAIDSSGSMNQKPLSNASDDDKHTMRIELVLEATVSMLEGVQAQQGSKDVLVQLVDFDNQYSNSKHEPDSKATSLGWYNIRDAITLLNDALDGLEKSSYKGVFDPAGGTDYEEAVYAIVNGYQDDKVTDLNGDTQDSIFIISDGENNGGWADPAESLWADFIEGKDVTVVGVGSEDKIPKTDLKEIAGDSGEVIYIPDDEVRAKLPQLRPTIGQAGSLLMAIAGAEAAAIVIDESNAQVAQFINQDGDVSVMPSGLTFTKDTVGNELVVDTEYGVFRIGSDGSYYFQPSESAPPIDEGKAVGFEIVLMVEDTNGQTTEQLVTLNVSHNGQVNRVDSSSFTASTGDDQVRGTDGDDVILGHSGNDVLDGGLGDDFLTGGSGNDILIGGLGNDILTGGEDADIFKWVDQTPNDSRTETDTITDFQVGQDHIDVSQLLIEDDTMEKLLEHLSVDKLDDNKLEIHITDSDKDVTITVNSVDNSFSSLSDGQITGESLNDLINSLFTNLPES
ncbi:tandem-95 repeat protein [Vibrio sp. JPW-9-11-11]|uniref:Ig-like domain-containing protein n=1 Tax=Vibrio sp. JPW-9-11-11 TaxID=1416532 RepID=UPI001592C537|nr:Ig-like domain-containing protein [Vibrio sp. JPW-9-11-11]NVD06606.1 tandem-95 repeat protein [Vibrio sp. JPW-9-11-11]